MNTPLQLYFKGQHVGEIITFSYETPWALGKVEFDDLALFNKLVSISKFRTFDTELESKELDDDQEEVEWEKMLKELNLSYEELKMTNDENWALKESNEIKREMRALIFSENGYIQWRP